MPGGVISTGSHPKALWPGIYDFWGQTYNAHKTEYTDLYDQLSSSMAYEQEVQVTPFGLAPMKPEGGMVSYDSEIQGPVQTYSHIAYSLGYIVTKEEIDDNLYEKVSQGRAKSNSFSIYQTVEYVGAAVYNDAFTGNVYLNADGVSLCNASHVNTTGGTYSNTLAPSADLMEASLEDACIQIMGYQNDRGLLINIMPESLIITRQNFYNAHRILKSIGQSGTANNDTNALRDTNAFPQGVKLNHFLTSAGAWFIRTNCMNGMQMFWRNRPEFDQDNDFDTKNAKASTYMRFSVGNTDPRAILGSNGP